MTGLIYAPGSDLAAKLRRRASRYLGKQTLEPDLARGLVSLSFDDCPRSVVENALPRIEAKGWRTTIYASLGLCETTNHLGLHMSEAEIVAAYKSGHEIGDHTYSHIDGLRERADMVIHDIARNRARFEALGLPRARTFAYPYGEVTPALKRRLKSEFELSRGIHSPSGPTLDLGLAASGRLYSDSIEDTLALIDQAAEEKSWLILFGHDVRKAPSEFGCTPKELDLILDRIDALNIDVLPVDQALDICTGDTDQKAAA